MRTFSKQVINFIFTSKMKIKHLVIKKCDLSDEREQNYHWLKEFIDAKKLKLIIQQTEIIHCKIRNWIEVI